MQSYIKCNTVVLRTGGLRKQLNSPSAPGSVSRRSFLTAILSP